MQEKGKNKTPHPRIRNFLTTLNNIIEDTDNEIGRLRLGQSISRPRKSKHVLKDQQREVIKERFRTGELTPWQYLNAMSNTIGGAVTLETGIESLIPMSQTLRTMKARIQW